MKAFLPLLIIVLFSCKSGSNHQQAEATNHSDSIKADSSLTISSVSPFLAEFKSKSDSMVLNLGSEQLLVSPLGKVFKNNKMLFNVNSKLPISKLYIHPSGTDFIVFYEYKDAGGAGSHAKRFSANKSAVWETPVYAFNLSQPLIVGDYAYMSTMVFLGKLNLNDGKYAWKFENLDKKFESFSQPKFLKDSLVLFMQNANSQIAGSILIDDKNGVIVKINM